MAILSLSNSKPEDLDSSLQNELGTVSAPPWKARLFTFCYALVPKTMMSEITAAFLLVFSLTQTLALMVNTDAAGDQLFGKLKYARLFPILDFDSHIVYIAALYLIFMATLLYSAMLVLTYLYPQSPVIYYSSLYVAPIFWVGLTPISELYISVFNCDTDGKHMVVSEMTCWVGEHIIHVCAASIGIVLWASHIVIFTFLNAHSHAHNNNPFAHYPWKFEVVYTLIRVILVANTWPHDWNGAADYVRDGLNLCIAAYLLSLIVITCPYYNALVSWMFTSSAIVVALMAFYDFIIDLCGTFYEVNVSTELIFMVATIAFFFPMGWIIRWRRLLHLVATMKPGTAEELDMRVQVLCNDLVTKMQVTGVPSLYVIGHMECIRHTALGTDKASPLSSGEKLKLQNGFNDDSSVDLDSGVDDDKLRAFIIYLLSNKESQEKMTTALSLQLARMYAHVLYNIHQACVRIADTEERDPGLFMQFSIHCLKMEITEAIDRNAAKREKKGQGSFYKVLQHEQLYTAFTHMLEQSTAMRIEFWNQLRHTPDLNLIHTIGARIIELNLNIANMWVKLTNIFPDHKPSLRLYEEYLKQVAGYVDEATALEKRIEQTIMDQSARELSNTQIFSEEATSIILSGGKTNTGKILKASITSRRIFGYAPKNLVNKNVTILMPQIIGRKHMSIMQEYFKTGKEYTMNLLTYSTFGLGRDGYIFPIKLAKQQLYSLKLGIIYVGSISVDVKSAEYNYVLTDDKGRIEGVTQRVGELLQITPMVLAEQSLYIQDYSPDVTMQNIEEMKGPQRLYFRFNRKLLGGSVALSDHNLESRVSGIAQYVRQDSTSKAAFKCDVETIDYSRVGLKMKVFKLPSLAAINKTTMALGNNLDDTEGGVGKARRIELKILPALPQTLRWDMVTRRRFSRTHIPHTTEEEKGEPEKKEESAQNKPLMSKPRRSKFAVDEMPRGSGHEETRPQLTTRGKLLTTGRTEDGDEPNLNLGPINILPTHEIREEDEKVPLTTENEQPNDYQSAAKVSTEAGGSTKTHRKAKALDQEMDEEMDYALINTAPLLPLNGKTIRMKQVIFSKATMGRVTTGFASDTASMSSTSTTRNRRHIDVLRRQKYIDFEPSSIKKLGCVVLVFGFLLFLGILSRLIMALSFNNRFGLFGSMMVMNARRFSIMANIAKTTRILTLYVPSQYSTTALIDATARNNYFNYSLMLQEGFRENVTTYKDYIIEQVTSDLSVLHEDENTLAGDVASFDKANAELVEPSSIGAFYAESNNTHQRYYGSMETTMLEMISHVLRVFDDFSGDLTEPINDTFDVSFLLNNTYGEFINIGKMSRDGLLNECLRIQTLQNNISFGLLMAMVSIIVILLIVLFPFLSIVNRELSSTLLLLVTISKSDVKIQIAKGMQFLRSMRTRAKDNTGEESESKDESVLEDDSEASKEPIEGESSSPESVQQNHGDGSMSRRIKPGSYTPHRDNTFLVIFGVAVFGGMMLGIYVGYDELAKNLSKSMVYQTDELYLLSSTIYTSSYIVAYLYQYIATNKTGICTNVECGVYYNYMHEKRLSDLNSMLVAHKRNSSYMYSSYLTYFHNMMETNACATIPYFQAVPNCATFMGGVFTQGAYAATIQLINLGDSILSDYKISNGTVSDMRTYLNDNRTLNIEILNHLLINPAYQLLVNSLVADGDTMISNNKMYAIVFFAAFVAILLVTSAIGGYWLLKHMCHAMYDTKALLANLPPDIIAENDSIRGYLMARLAEINT